MTIEQSELREKIKRTIRLAMANELTSGTFSVRQANRETVADKCADTVMESLTAAHVVPTAEEPANGLPTLDEYRSNLVEECAKVAEELSEEWRPGYKGAAKAIAKAIRSLALHERPSAEID